MLKLENLPSSESPGDIVAKYLAFSNKSIEAFEKPDDPSSEKGKLLDRENESVNLIILKVVKKANFIFDNKDWQRPSLSKSDDRPRLDKVIGSN